MLNYLSSFLVERDYVRHAVWGWRSGESTRLPPMWPGLDSQTRRHMWVEFVGFSPGTRVSPLLKKNHNLTWFAFIVNFSLVCPISAPALERPDTQIKFLSFFFTMVSLNFVFAVAVGGALRPSTLYFKMTFLINSVRRIDLWDNLLPSTYKTFEAWSLQFCIYTLRACSFSPVYVSYQSVNDDSTGKRGLKIGCT